MSFETGPYLQVAAFCDSVIEDKTGALSLIRIVDTLTHTEAGPEPPSEMPPVPWRMKLVLMLKAGRARGRHEVKIVPELPSTERKEPIILTTHFEADERGHNHIVDIDFTFTMEGLYWFNVYFDDILLSKMPFRVKYMRLVTGSTLL